jgi:dTDP-4-dehydrorhamnose 3,5-epimerase
VRFLPTGLPEVVLIERDLHQDDRGFLMETFHAERYAAAGIPVCFVLDLYTRSARGTLRGLHFQAPDPQGKLVEVVRGAILDVVVDIRAGSRTFGQWVSFELSEDTRQQLWVPAGFAHGYCVVTDTADVVYKLSAPFVPTSARRLAWDDPALGIPWPTKDPLLSPADRAAPNLADQAVLPTVEPPAEPSPVSVSQT